MSKSKGNVIDPLLLMDGMERPLRMTLCSMAAQGRILNCQNKELKDKNFNKNMECCKVL